MEMEIVDRTGHEGPMRLGIGTELHRDALRQCGIERPIYVRQLEGIVEDPALLQSAFRADDVVVLVQPNLLPIRYLKLIGDMGVKFEVPGHPVMVATNDEQRRALRQMKPIGLDAPRIEKRGGKVLYPQPSEEQARYLVALWHSPAKLAAVVEDAQRHMQSDFPGTWVRDRVKKYTGSASRKPDAPGKHEFKYVPHGREG